MNRITLQEHPALHSVQRRTAIAAICYNSNNLVGVRPERFELPTS